MPTKFFLSLPVKDARRSAAFYEGLGFALDPKFAGVDAACLVISETTSVMLGPRERLEQLTTRAIADPQTTVGGLMSLWFDSREEVDALVVAALKGGGTEAHPAEDMGFMYQRAFYDLDGHGWGVGWMNPDAPMPTGEEAN